MGDTQAKFITLEGIEGSGKSMQLRLLEDELNTRRIPFVTTREPGSTAFGAALRQILLQTDGPQRHAMPELLLYLADRCQDLEEIIRPALAQGCHVLCDRYHDATMAYQGYARGIGFHKIELLAKILGIRKPDLTFVLDVDVEFGLERARARNAQQNRETLSRFEAEAIEFHEKVREGYRILALREPERVHLIEGMGTPEEVFRRIRKVLESEKIL